VKRVVASFIEAFGGIDILVNNAGYGYFAPLTELDTAKFEKQFATNVTGAMLMAREVAPHFIAQGGGHLINVSSTSGLSGGKNSTGLQRFQVRAAGMNECWRAELRPHNVRVTLVNPSEVQTPFFSKVGHEQVLSEKKLRGERDRRRHCGGAGDRRPRVHSGILGLCHQSVLTPAVPAIQSPVPARACTGREVVGPAY